MSTSKASESAGFRATAYLTPPQIKVLSTLDADAIKGMLVISTFPDDDVEITWADLDGTLHAKTIGPNGEMKNDLEDASGA